MGIKLLVFGLAVAAKGTEWFLFQIYRGFK